jgi:hypothetical protein
MQQRVIIYERSFHSNFKQVLTTLFILQLLPKANPTGQLLEVQLLRDLFRDWRHLLQKLLVLLICTTGGYSSHDYIDWSWGSTTSCMPRLGSGWTSPDA